MEDALFGLFTKFIAFGLVTAIGWSLYKGVVFLLDKGSDKVEDLIRKKKKEQ